VIYVLGISAFYHDSAAVLIKDGVIVAAAQEERFTRTKHDSSFPYNAIKFVLENQRITLSQVDKIVFYEKPFLKFNRLVETYLAFVPRGFKQFAKAMPSWIKSKLFLKKLIFDSLKKNDENFNEEEKILFTEHHLSHAASAFYPSSFDEAIILTADGVGEWATTTIAIGKKNKVDIVKEIHFPHSLGLLYSAFTYYLGFTVNSGEYKVMGLAPYGEPKYTKEILNNLIDVKKDGSFALNMSFFNFATGLTMTNKKFDNLFGKKNRDPEIENLTQFHMDIAASIQEVTEIIILKICNFLKSKYKIENLCLAGGVALNCVANGKILKNKIFKNIWIQPAAGDAGGALGGPLYYWFNELENKRVTNYNKDSMFGSYLGPSYTQEEIKSELDRLGAVYQNLEEKEILEITAKHLFNQKSIGWFQGKMEFGPRALGNRSILADPRSEFMQKNLNLKIKFRESFRPFAPSVADENLKEWFDLEISNPYMLIVADVSKHKRVEISQEDQKKKGIDRLNVIKSVIPAVTHVDFTARIQSVNKEVNSLYYRLIKEFEKKSGVPILLNTSFNIRGEPIVNSVEDAYSCFLVTNLDYLVCGNFILEKEKQFNLV
jgi:carbamoyltransferase